MKKFLTIVKCIVPVFSKPLVGRIKKLLFFLFWSTFTLAQTSPISLGELQPFWRSQPVLGPFVQDSLNIVAVNDSMFQTDFQCQKRSFIKEVPLAENLSVVGLLGGYISYQGISGNLTTPEGTALLEKRLEYDFVYRNDTGIIDTASPSSFPFKENKVKTRPNVVLILTDDQGWGDLSVNGNINLNTPNIDKLAETGVTFDRFYVSPVCAPTRAELLTGRYHLRVGVTGVSSGEERLNLNETTIAEVFKNAGYTTAAYGKWHNGMQAPYHPNTRGFQDFYGFCSGHWGDYFSPMLEHNGEIVKGNGFIIDDLTDHGLAFIEKNKDNPFFLYLPINTPHSPMQVPDRYWNKFKDKELTKRGTDFENEDILHTKAALAMSENIDWNVGRLMAKLDELKLSENTIIIYLSDNGPNGHRWNGGMKGIKGSTDEGGVRSPMFMKWKGTLEAGKMIKEISGAIDLLPTLTDLASIAYNSKKELDGVSLKPLLLENNTMWEDRFIINCWRKRTSIRSQNYRLRYNGELFDMVGDSNQTKDISAEKPRIFKNLSEVKERWESEIVSKIPGTDNRPFIIGHPSLKTTQIPARDAELYGNVKRSNQYPNCSYLTNWKSSNDKISWNAEVPKEGDFEVVIYYTCASESIGSTFELSFGDAKLISKITEPFNPPEKGMENDRFERIESYIKEFKPLKIGTIHLKKGHGVLELQATEIPGAQVMDFRLLILERI